MNKTVPGIRSEHSAAHWGFSQMGPQYLLAMAASLITAKDYIAELNIMPLGQFKSYKIFVVCYTAAHCTVLYYCPISCFIKCACATAKVVHY